MSSVDNRIVNMEFNNARFEKNAKQSMSTLDKLKEKLKFRDTEKELREFQNTADTFSLEHMSNALDKIANKFTLLGQVGYQAMERIANKVLNVGENMVRSLSFDQISGGWTKYTEETNSVQAIIAAVKRRGQTKEDVYGALDYLAEYSDASSYSFTQMTGALSMFVGAGQDMDKSAQAIKGIGNAAAVAGVSIQDASYAFRNFSDAIGKGYFERRDWDSIRLIHMDTEELREEFIQTAKDLKVLDEQGRITVDRFGKKLKTPVEVTAANIADTLSYGWLNDKVIMQTLARYAENAEATQAATYSRTFTDVMDTLKDVISTGWKDTFKLIFGDIEEATDFFTNVANNASEAVAEVGELRNAVFQGWRDHGGRDSAISALKNIWDTVLAVKKEIGYSIFDVFNYDGSARGLLGLDGEFLTGNKSLFTGFSLANLTKSIENATKAVKDWFNSTDDNGVRRITQIRKLFDGIFSVVDIVRRVIGGIFTFIKDIFHQLKPTFSALWDFVQLIAGDLFKADQKLRNSTGITDFFRNLAKIFEPITSRLPKIIKWIQDLYTKVKTFLKTNPRMIAMQEATKRLFNAFIKFIPDAIDSLVQFGKQIWETIKNSEEWKWLKTNFEKYIKPVGQFLWDFAVEAKNALADFFEMDTSGETGLWNKLKKRFSAFERLGPWFDKQWKSLKEKIPFLQKVEDWWNTSPFIREMKQFFKTVGEAINAFFSLSFEGTDLEGSGSIFAKLKARWEAAWNLLQPYFQSKWDQFSKWWKSIDWKQKLKDGIKNLWETLGKIFSPGGPEDGSIGSKIGNFLKPIGDWISEKLNAVWTYLFGEKKAVQGTVTKKAEAEAKKDEKESEGGGGGEKQKTIWTIIGDWIVNAVTVTRQTLDDIWQRISKSLGDSIDTVQQFFKDHDIWGFLTNLAGLKILWNAGYMVRKFGKVGKSLSDMFGSIGDMFDTVSKGIKNGFKKKTDWSEKLKNIGIALLAIAGSIWIIIQCIEQINKIPEKEFWEGAKRVGIIMGALTVMVAALNLTGGKEGGKIGGALKPLLTVFAIILLINKFVKLNEELKKISDQEMTRTGLWLAAIIGVMALLMYADSNFSDENTKSTRILLSAIGVAILMKAYASAVEKLANVGQTEMWMPALFVDGIVALLALLMKADSKSEGGNFRILLAAIGVALMLKSYANAVEKLSKIKTKDLLIAGLLVDSIVALMALLISVSNKSNGKGMAAMGIALVCILAIMWSYVLIMEKLKDIDPTLVLNFSIAIGVLTVAVVAMAGAMALLGKVDIATVAKGAVVMVIAAAAIGAAIALILTLVSQSIADFSGTIAIVGANLAAYNDNVKDIDFNKLGDSVRFIIDIAGTLVAVGTRNYGDLEKFITCLGRMGGVLVIYNSNLKKVKDMQKLKDSVTVIKEMGDTIAGIPDLTDKATSIASIGGAIGLYIDTMKQKLGDETLDTSNLPDTDSILAVFGALKSAFGDETLASDDLESVGSFATGDKATALTNFAIGLENIATAISTFSSTATTLEFGDINKAITALGNISNVAPVLNSGAVIQIGDFSITLGEQKENLTLFSADIVNLGTALESFSASMEKVDQGQVDYGVTVLGKITEINNALPEEGGLKQLLVGHKQTLTNFGANLRNLGSGAAAFSEAIVGGKFNETKDIMENAVSTIERLAKANNKLPESGGLAQWIAGQKDFSKFSGNLENLGEGAKKFSIAIVGGKFDNAEVIDKAVGVVVTLAEANSNLPLEGGLRGWFAGEQSFSNFSSNLPALAQAAVDFAKEVSGAESYFQNDTVIKSACDAILALATANSKLPKTGGISSWFSGDESMKNFKEGLEYLAHGIIDFATIIHTGWKWKDKDGNNLSYNLSMIDDTTMTAVKIATDIAKNMSSFSKYNDKFGDWSALRSYFSTFADGMVIVFGKLNSVAKNPDVNLESLSSLSDDLFMIGSFFQEYNLLYDKSLQYGSNDTDYTTFFTWIDDLFARLRSYTPGEFDDVVGAFNSLSGLFEQIDFGAIEGSFGEESNTLIDKLFSAFNVKPLNSKASSAISNTMNGASTKARTYETNFYNTGIYMMRGLGNGIVANRYAVLNAVGNVMRLAVDTAHSILGIASPSKVFEEIGMYSDQGLANGFINYSGVVDRAVESVSSTAMNTALNEIKALADISLENLDSQPTIRPVLDTQNISAGIGYIDEIFNQKRAVRFDTGEINATAQLIGTDYTYDLGAITQRVQDVNDKLDKLTEVMSKMQVVMDSGELVGALEGQIDKRMGARARRGERGN